MGSGLGVWGFRARGAIDWFNATNLVGTAVAYSYSYLAQSV
jgi:hypothetical protein